MNIYYFANAVYQYGHSKSIYDIIENENKSIIKKSEIPELIKSDSSELIVTMGAGDIGDEVELIKKTLAENS